MALINQNTLFDIVKKYIDAKIDNAYEMIQILLDNLDFKQVAANIDDISTVAECIRDPECGSGSGTGGGQLLGSSADKCIQYMGTKSLVSENIVIDRNRVAFSVEEFELAEGATITVEAGSIYKIL